VSAHRLGLAREAACQFGSIAGPSRGLPLADACNRIGSSTLDRTSMPLASVGTNMRSFQEMISWKRP
jgi:hypothetical protein